MSRATIPGRRPCAAIASPPSKRLPISRARLGALGMCLLGTLTVVSVGAGSLTPASAAGSTSADLVVNGNFTAPAISTTGGPMELAPGSQRAAGFTGWTMTAPVADLDGTGYINPAPGSGATFVLANSFGVPHTPNTGIFQAVATTCFLPTKSLG